MVRPSSGLVLADKLELARSFAARTRGLMFRDRLQPGQGLLIEPCNGIHMLFMRFPIDAIFMDRQGRVLKVCRSLRPWTGMVPLVAGANCAVELPAGVLDGVDLRIGEPLVVETGGE